MKPQCSLLCWQQPITCLAISHINEPITANSVPFTSASFVFSHLRLSFRNGPFQIPPPKADINLFYPQYVPNNPPLYSFILSAAKIMKPFIMRLSEASSYFPLLILMMIIMINVALLNGARIRCRSHICTAIIPMNRTRGEKHLFTYEKICFCQPSLFSCEICLTIFLILP